MTKPWRKIRCKARCGLSCRWTIGQIEDDLWKVVALGDIKARGNPYPTDFAPFELMNAVVNGPKFDTAASAEAFVRGL